MLAPAFIAICLNIMLYVHSSLFTISLQKYLLRMNSVSRFLWGDETHCQRKMHFFFLKALRLCRMKMVEGCVRAWAQFNAIPKCYTERTAHTLHKYEGKNNPFLETVKVSLKWLHNCIFSIIFFPITLEDQLHIEKCPLEFICKISCVHYFLYMQKLIES